MVLFRYSFVLTHFFILRQSNKTNEAEFEAQILEQQRQRSLQQKRLTDRINGIHRAALVGDISRAERSIKSKFDGVFKSSFFFIFIHFFRGCCGPIDQA